VHQALLHLTPAVEGTLRRLEERSEPSGAPAVPVDTLIQGMAQARLIHPAQDYIDGVFYVGVPVGERVFLVTSARTAISPQDLPAGVKLDQRDFDRCDFSQRGIQAYLAGELTVTTPAILKTLEAYFARFAIYPQRDIPRLLAIWTLGTFVYRIFDIYPYLFFRSPQKRCGKSRAEDLIAMVAFNASNRETRPTEASLFRGPANNGGTLILDEIELLGDKDQELYGGLLAVLNSGFQRGGDVPRMEKHGDRFIEVKYPTYAPRVLAGIKKLAETLEDRGIEVMMHRKRKDEVVERFSPRRIRAETQAIRDQCYVWALTHAAEVAEIYDSGQLPDLAGLDDRAIDLWEPLMTLAYLAEQEARESEERAEYMAPLKTLARELCQVRDDSDTETAQLITALWAILRARGAAAVDLGPAELLPLVQAKGFGWVRSTKKLGDLMQGLGFFRESVRTTRGPRRLYRLSVSRLHDLRERYGSQEGQDAEEQTHGK
jgi:hypothetical protein